MRLAPGVVAACALAVAAGCGGAKAVAQVGEVKIPESKVDQAIAAGAAEAKAEGREFPKEGSPAYEAVRRHVVDLLVYREELRQKAASLGIEVTDAQVRARVESAGEAEAGGGAEEAAQKDQARAGLLVQRLYDYVARRIVVTSDEAHAYYDAHRSAFQGQSFEKARASIVRQLLGTKRNEALERMLAQMKRDFAPKVKYFER